MSKNRDKYEFGDANLYDIRNRNELRVIKAIEEYLQDNQFLGFNAKDIQDIYALALNNLPARYTQVGTIVLRDPVKDYEVSEAVERSALQVQKVPKH
ncbi:late competence development ComFB family protein [Desulfovibrio litoralis]|uniref:Late competence development protein ComFB n=1 Tax=Desulfovibrio litoralis DSM 11393 TaxID=1121455 RepID=A0A1M7TEV1_9BACT|nr:late competence development ComFB family protein [Desulfovibrio litoralis]SHN69216.1 Late competence development protein ComFB [Desulfovibrio litoralis DSM 11393]